MKFFFFTTLLFLNFQFWVKADTVDFWKVYYNQKLMATFQENGNKILKFNLNSIKMDDKISVVYYRDTPCFDCPTLLIAQDEHKKSLIMAKGKGTFNPITFSLNLLKKSGRKYIEIYYYEERGINIFDKVLVVKLLLE